jgi:hypothetical protein
VQAAMVTFPGVAASDLHADEANTGVMLAIECWCANGCRVYRAKSCVRVVSWRFVVAIRRLCGIR